MLITFENYVPIARADDVAWTTIKIEEAAAYTGPWTLIDSITIDPVDADPEQPAPRTFSTEYGTLANGWYRVSFLDVHGNSSVADPRQNIPTEIMASFDDINAHLTDKAITATPDNSALVQISVARLIRGYLSRIIDVATLLSWNTPALTPDIVREAAGMLVASQVFINQIAKSSSVIPVDHFSQILYNKAIEILDQIVVGDIIIPGLIDTPQENLSTLDFFPIDNTDQAFTLSQRLD